LTPKPTSELYLIELYVLVVSKGVTAAMLEQERGRKAELRRRSILLKSEDLSRSEVLLMFSSPLPSFVAGL